MSAKWRALQHRHRYTYNAVIFPPHFIEELNQTPCTHFFSELKQLTSLNSTYAQLNHAKNIASAFTTLLSNPNADRESISLASKSYLEILFLENSMPLHKTLVSALVKAKNFQSLIGECFLQLCREYGEENGKGKRFCVSRVALSMMSTPKLGYLVEVVEECAVLVGLHVVSGLGFVVSETNEYSRPSPLVMEQCQEALSCLYYLLQRFPTKFSDAGGESMGVSEMILTTILSILKSEAFSRDCLVAAGVSLCAALQVCLSPEELGLFIMEGVFNQTSIVTCNIRLSDVVGQIPYKGDFISEIRYFSALSRLCLFRGILTAVPRAVLNTHYVVSNDFSDSISGSVDCSKLVKTILYDGILPELCNYCENPIDSHFNFHALTVMQICLQQIKTSIQSNVCEFVEDYDPISENMGTRILKTVWNNLEDPLSQTVKQVHLIFDLFLDIQASLHLVEGSEKIKLFLTGIASNLLRLEPRCKGRYVPLASLTKRLGAKTILDMNPDLLFETTKAYIDDDVCCAATTFLKCLLECLRDEYWNSDGIEDGYRKYRGLCLPPFLYGLASGVAKLRTNLNTYALPVLLDLDMDGIFPMLAFLDIRLGGDDSEIVYPELRQMDVSIEIEQQVAVMVSLLKVARVLALIEGDMDWYENYSALGDDAMLNAESCNFHSLVFIKGIKVKIPVKWLVVALTHTDESLRMDAAETLFINPKTASLPSLLELSLMKNAVPLNMRCCSTAFQMKWTSLFRKFFSRVRTALERQFKQGNWQPVESRDPSKVSQMGTAKTVEDRAEDLFNFMRWLNCFLFFSCYPSAPYERKKMAMEFILIMLSVWSMPPLQGNGDATSPGISLYPYSKGFTLPDSTLLLVGSIVDSWDQLRESSFRILLHFPTPLPGMHSPDMVREVIIWAKKLVCSPRVRESDAGALTLRLIFRKYVLELGWVVRPSCYTVSFLPQLELPNGDDRNITSSSPALEYIRSLIDWLLLAVEDGEKDLSDACKNSCVHGVLLTLRYTFEELDWNSDVVLKSNTAMKLALEKLLELVMRITSLALWVVSADAWCLPDDMEDDDDAFALEVPLETEVSAINPEDEVKNTKLVRDVRPSEQMVMVGCWLAMKEVSLLLGTIIRKIPLPTSDASNMRIPDADKPTVLSMASDAMLDLKQLQIIGNHFLEVILKMKHNGAIDKTRAGFTALCNRLLSSNDPRLCKLTETWMEQLMERMVAKGQTVDDLLRRSAGIPAAFSAFFLSEPEGTPKKLLPRALRWLIDVAKKSLADQTKAERSDADLCNGVSTKSSEVHKLVPELNAIEKISKIRDEGVVPTVHAFNVLRATFNDTNLATDTSGFSAEAVIIAIRSFSSPYWEVRNSACLAYTALVRRMIGFLNVQKRESARRALTGLEFFHRYPSLHSFLLDELKVATELLSDGSSQHLGANLKNVVHPSLCPMLIFLSRLKPSAIASDTGDALDPFLFTPFIRKCSIQSNLRIRVLASRALTGLISNEKLPVVLLNIASEIPHLDDQIADSDSVRSSLYMTSGSSSFPYNSIHGMLLQLSTLLDTNCRNLADFSKKDKILDDLIQILASCSWIGRPGKCSCPILNSCFLQVLDNMLSIARTCRQSKSIGAILNILLDLSSECLDIESFNGRSYYDPTVAELRKQAVSSFLNCVWPTSKEVAEEDLLVPWKTHSSALYFSKPSELDVLSLGFREKLLCSMSDASYEVRIAALKWLLLFLKVTNSGSECSQPNFETKKVFCENSNLQAKLMELLLAEKNKKCTYYILKILYTWNLLCFQFNRQQTRETRYVGNMDLDSVFQFWNKLVSLYKVTRHAKTRQTLICCMGICVKRFAGLLLSSICPDLEMNEVVESRQSDRDTSLSNLYDCISYFVNLIDENSDAAEPVNMRKAAAESMVASGLLDQTEYIGSSVFNNCIPHQNLYYQFSAKDAVNMYAHKVLDLWLVCIKLLEDEDVGLRRQLALDVQKVLVSKNGGKNLQAGVIPSQVEKVIERSFGHLSSIFGHWIDYYDYLCRWVLSAANDANYVVSEGDLVRRVFDKEIDNHHEEKLLICQICCYHLEKLPISKTWTVDLCDRDQFRNFLCDWRRRFSQQLVTFVNDHVGKQGGTDWVGGVGNHKDAFLPLYANLLAFYALSNCLSYGETEPNESILSEVIELGQVICPFFRNPQICNLHLLVVKSHEKFVGSAPHNLTAKCLGDCCAWDGFDPYFLLR